MPLYRHIAGATLTIIFLAVSAAAAPSYSGFYAFGDSLVDSGNAQEAADFLNDLPFVSVRDPAPAKEGYFEGRFTNGHNFVDRLSLALVGQTPETTFPYGFPLPGGILFPFARPHGNTINFAYGGAEISGGRLPDASEQVDAYDGLSGPADPGALYLLTFGGNDIRDLVPSDETPVTGDAATAALTAAAQELAEQVAFLYSIGAENIIVTGVPDVGLIPRYTDEARAALASAYSIQLDTLVRNALDALTRDVGDNLLYFSLLDLSEDVAEDPAAFGFTNITQPCLTVQTPSPNIDCTGFLFFDDIHPTGVAHSLIADEILRRLDGSDVLALASSDPIPEPATIGLLGAGLVSLGFMRRRRA